MCSPDKHTARNKLLLRLEREARQLHRALQEAPILPLDEPYQRGWIKFYVLCEDIRLRHDVEIFRTVLAPINQRIWARTREFIGRDKKPIELRPGIILMRGWQRLNWTAAQRRLCAYGPWKIETGFDEPHHRHFLRRSGHLVGFSIQNPRWLEEAIEPWMITHRKANLPEVERRLAEIDSYLKHTCGRQRLCNLHGYQDVGISLSAASFVVKPPSPKIHMSKKFPLLRAVPAIFKTVSALLFAALIKPPFEDTSTGRCPAKLSLKYFRMFF